MYQKSITHYITKIVVDVLFYISVLCTLAEPFVIGPLFGWIGYPYSGYFRAFAIVVFLSGICCVYILFNLKLMFRSLLVGNPFVDKNVCLLRRISVACGLIALMYAAKTVFMFTIASLVITAVFVVGCLFCLTLKDLFKQAVNYKTENELTI